MTQSHVNVVYIDNALSILALLASVSTSPADPWHATEGDLRMYSPSQNKRQFENKNHLPPVVHVYCDYTQTRTQYECCAKTANHLHTLHTSTTSALETDFTRNPFPFPTPFPTKNACKHQILHQAIHVYLLRRRDHVCDCRIRINCHRAYS